MAADPTADTAPNLSLCNPIRLRSDTDQAVPIRMKNLRLCDPIWFSEALIKYTACERATAKKSFPFAARLPSRVQLQRQSALTRSFDHFISESNLLAYNSLPT